MDNPEHKEMLSNLIEAKDSKNLEYPKDIGSHWTRSFGSHPDVRLNNRNHESWQIEGLIRKIHVKSRLWDNRHIVQGIQVFLDNGMTHAFGMTLNDDFR